MTGQDTTEDESTTILDEVIPTTSEVATTTSSEAAAAAAAVVPPSIVNSFNEVNDDGSYTFGYEASDGTFKTESKDAEGNVVGKFHAFPNKSKKAWNCAAIDRVTYIVP